MSTYKVHNLGEGARPAPFGYSSWLDYWEKATGMKANRCHRVDCTQLLAKATDGAHVQLDNPNDNHWYIVPVWSTFHSRRTIGICDRPKRNPMVIIRMCHSEIIAMAFFFLLSKIHRHDKLKHRKNTIIHLIVEAICVYKS